MKTKERAVKQRIRWRLHTIGTIGSHIQSICFRVKHANPKCCIFDPKEGTIALWIRHAIWSGLLARSEQLVSWGRNAWFPWILHRKEKSLSSQRCTLLKPFLPRLCRRKEAPSSLSEDIVMNPCWNKFTSIAWLRIVGNSTPTSLKQWQAHQP